VTTDRFKPVRDHLVAACNLLAGYSERTEGLSDRLRAVERQMDWRGDPHAALYALPTIIADLGELKALPGVNEAIVQLESALAMLRTTA